MHRYKIDTGADLQASQNRYILLILNGRGERIRTSDPLVPNQVRYQTALRPELFLSGSRRLAHPGMQAFGLACGLTESTLRV
jgi:hypothetical protein